MTGDLPTDAVREWCRVNEVDPSEASVPRVAGAMLQPPRAVRRALGSLADGTDDLVTVTVDGEGRLRCPRCGEPLGPPSTVVVYCEELGRERLPAAGWKCGDGHDSTRVLLTLSTAVDHVDEWCHDGWVATEVPYVEEQAVVPERELQSGGETA